MSSDHAGDIHITRAPARAEHFPPSSEKPPHTSQTEIPVFTYLQETANHQKHRNLPPREDEVDVGGGKRKIPSPDGQVRQEAPCQPQTGKQRRWEEEEVQMVTQRLSRERREAAGQSLESHMCLQREDGHCSNSQRSTSGGQNSTFLSAFYFKTLIFFCFIYICSDVESLKLNWFYLNKVYIVCWFILFHKSPLS